MMSPFLEAVETTQDWDNVMGSNLEDEFRTKHLTTEPCNSDIDRALDFCELYINYGCETCAVREFECWFNQTEWYSPSEEFQHEVLGFCTQNGCTVYEIMDNFCRNKVIGVVVTR